MFQIHAWFLTETKWCFKCHDWFIVPNEELNPTEWELNPTDWDTLVMEPARSGSEMRTRTQSDSASPTEVPIDKDCVLRLFVKKGH